MTSIRNGWKRALGSLSLAFLGLTMALGFGSEVLAQEPERPDIQDIMEASESDSSSLSLPAAPDEFVVGALSGSVAYAK